MPPAIRVHTPLNPRLVRQQHHVHRLAGGTAGCDTSRHFVVKTICGPTLICGSDGGVAFISISRWATPDTRWAWR